MKHAIVTGGAGLIGAEVCTALQMADYDVVSFDLTAPPAGIPSIICDVSDEAAVALAFAELGWDNLDLLINNAGIATPDRGEITHLTLDDWRKVTDSHLVSAFLMTRGALPLMGEGASIINMLSTRAFMSEKNTEAYAAAKGGLFGLTHALAVSLGPKIRVNGIAPGWITKDTDLRRIDHDQHPAGRVGRPEDIARAVLYLASAGFVTGEVLMIDGGMTRKMIYAE
ncbi:MAG: SDR family oxidoreductase [Rhizobium rhizophilum]|uniref:SDR family oxidoreductase n=1 Tax=Rhizobium rhizophilum TaxID=1850373 RepID=UPI00391BAF78